MTAAASHETPLVAVITPVYNGAAFLAETMDAVQAQTYPNVVHIVLDNASTDATPEILARYASARVPVRVFRNPSVLPITQNWNAALAHTPAEAKYFRILSADDLIAPEFIARTVDLAERHPSVAVVGCGLNHRSDKPAAALWETGRELFPGREAVRRFFDGTGLIIAHQTLIRRTALNRRQPFLDEVLVASDTDFCLALLRDGDWGFVHDVLATTRDHPGSHTETVVSRLMMHRSDFLALAERHAEFAFGPEEGRRLVQKYRRYYLRQLLRWRAGATRDIYDRHMRALKGFGARPLAWQLFDAIVDWPLARFGLRPVWSGHPF